MRFDAKMELKAYITKDNINYTSTTSADWAYDLVPNMQNPYAPPAPLYWASIVHCTLVGWIWFLKKSPPQSGNTASLIFPGDACAGGGLSEHDAVYVGDHFRWLLDATGITEEKGWWIKKGLEQLRKPSWQSPPKGGGGRGGGGGGGGGWMLAAVVAVVGSSSRSTTTTRTNSL